MVTNESWFNLSTPDRCKSSTYGTENLMLPATSFRFGDRFGSGSVMVWDAQTSTG